MTPKVRSYTDPSITLSLTVVEKDNFSSNQIVTIISLKEKSRRESKGRAKEDLCGRKLCGVVYSTYT